MAWQKRDICECVFSAIQLSRFLDTLQTMAERKEKIPFSHFQTIVSSEANFEYACKVIPSAFRSDLESNLEWLGDAIREGNNEEIKKRTLFIRNSLMDIVARCKIGESD